MREMVLPTERDFDPYGGCLDAQKSWKHFGGKTLDDAYKLFCDNPLHYQEDFMFMGHAALAYYFPVIDRYLRTGDDDNQALIIAQGLELQFQFENDDVAKIEKLKRPIIELANFIVQNIDSYGDNTEDQTKIKNAWQRIARSLA